MKPIVVRAADAESIAQLWGELRRVDRLKGGETVTLDVSGIPAATAATFFQAPRSHFFPLPAARTLPSARRPRV